VGGGGDLVDGGIEGFAVGLRRRVEARQLADELERGVADLLIRRGRVEVEQCPDVAAHRPLLLLGPIT
jgi:hypothetical protein